MQYPEVKLQPEHSSQSVLLCPICGDDYLHQEAPIVGLDEIHISFWCEQCGQDGRGNPRAQLKFSLRIEQHKGKTYVYWRDAHRA